MAMSAHLGDNRRRRGGSSTHVEQQCFAPQELAKLLELRARVESCGVNIELGLDERRLRFARWLVEHGKLSEGLM